MVIKIPTKEIGGNEFPRTASLSVYVGHDGLMDFSIKETFSGGSNERRDAIILACASKRIFCWITRNRRPARFVDHGIDGP